MSKKKRKRKYGYECEPISADLNFDCAPELRTPWLATDITGVFLFGTDPASTDYVHVYGHFQRLVVYNNYMFSYDVCHGLN